MSVVVYTTPTCGFCHQVKAHLHQRGVPFIEYAALLRHRPSAGTGRQPPRWCGCRGSSASETPPTD